MSFVLDALMKLLYVTRLYYDSSFGNRRTGPRQDKATRDRNDQIQRAQAELVSNQLTISAFLDELSHFEEEIENVGPYIHGKSLR